MDQFQQLEVDMVVVEHRQDLQVQEDLVDLEVVVEQHHRQEVLVLEHQDKDLMVELVVVVELMTLVLAAVVPVVQDPMLLLRAMADQVEMVFH